MHPGSFFQGLCFELYPSLFHPYWGGGVTYFLCVGQKQDIISWQMEERGKKKKKKAYLDSTICS